LICETAVYIALGVCINLFYLTMDDTGNDQQPPAIEIQRDPILHRYQNKKTCFLYFTNFRSSALLGQAGKLSPAGGYAVLVAGLLVENRNELPINIVRIQRAK